MKRLRVLEFYSGIGGMHFALQESGVEHEVVQALDMNEVANVVYAHNFPHVPINNTDIGRLGEDWLDKQCADLWTMSPPCQPYTRGGLQKGSNDARASSLLCLLSALGKMKNPPSYIMLENVKGFEQSDTFNTLIQTLLAVNYSVENFLLTPDQYGIPNTRVRFYCLARRLREPSVGAVASEIIRDSIPSVSETCSRKKIEEFLDPEARGNVQFIVPSAFLRGLERGYRFDIVTPLDRISTCFTKNYAKNFKGSGPLLLPTDPAPTKHDIAAYDAKTLQRHGLRFFAPREIANLLCFPDNFTFPPSVTTKQAYRLLGNSINVHVVALLLQHLLSAE